MLRFGLSAALIVGIVLLAFAFFSEKSKEAKESNVVAGTITQEVHETPQTISSDDGSANGLDDTPRMMLTGTTDIPLYPDARQVEHREGTPYDKPGGGEFKFWSDSSVDEVVSFYRRELAKSGWTVDVDDNPAGSPTMASIDFGWINPVKEVPLRRHLVIWIDGWVTGCKVWIRFERWPVAEYVPLYPDAQQVQVTWVKPWVEYPEIDYFERLTTYETKGTPAEIEAYYKDAMAQHGWKMGRSEPPNKLFFSYQHDLSCPPDSRATWCTTGSRVDISISPQEGGTTKVELSVGGNEVQALYRGD